MSNAVNEIVENKRMILFSILSFVSESEMSDTPSQPVFVQPLLDTTLNEGQKLKLHAAINAHPEPEVKYLVLLSKNVSRFFFVFDKCRLFGIITIFH